MDKNTVTYTDVIQYFACTEDEKYIERKTSKRGGYFRVADCIYSATFVINLKRNVVFVHEKISSCVLIEI